MLHGAANKEQKSNYIIVKNTIPGNTTRLYLYDVFSSTGSQEVVRVDYLDVKLDASNKIINDGNLEINCLCALYARNNYDSGGTTNVLNYLNGDLKNTKLYTNNADDVDSSKHLYFYHQFICDGSNGNGVVKFEQWVQSARKPVGIKAEDRNTLYGTSKTIYGATVVLPYDGASKTDKIGRYAPSNAEKVDAKARGRDPRFFGEIKMTYEKPTLINPQMNINDIELNVGESKDVNFTYTGTATVSVSNPKPNIANVSVTGNKLTVIGKQTGTTQITLSAPASGNYAAVSAKCNITVREKMTPALSINNVTLNVGDSITVNYTYTGNATPQISVNDNSIASISPNTTAKSVTVTGKKGGTTTMTLSAPENSQYKAASTTATITVNKLTPTLTIENVTVGVNQSKTVYYTYTGDAVPTIKVNDSSIASISPNTTAKSILVKGLKGGTTTMTITAAATDKYKEVSATATITVNKKDSTLIIQDVTVEAGQTKTVNYVYDGDGTLKIKYNPNLTIANASLDAATKTLTVTGIKAGTTKMTLSAPATAKYNEVSKIVNITVTAPQKITPTLEIEDVTVEAGKEMTVYYTYTGDGTPKIESNPDSTIATASLSTATKKVTVTGIKAGTTSMTVTAEATNKYNAVSKTVSITVTAPEKQTPTLEIEDVTVEVGKSTQVDYTYTGDGTPKIQNVVDSTIANATIGTKWVNVTGIQSGKTSMTIFAEETETYNAVSKTVNITVIGSTVQKQDPILALSDVTVEVGQTKTVNYTYTGDGFVFEPGSYDTNIADVLVDNSANKVTVTGNKIGTTSMHLSALGTDKYNSIVTEATITVIASTAPQKQYPTLTLPNVTVEVGQSKTVNYTYTGDGTLTLSGYSGTIADVTINKAAQTVTVTGKQAGSTSMTLTASGTSQYYGTSKTASITVNAGTPPPPAESTKIPIPYISSYLIYNGAYQQPTIVNFDASTMTVTGNSQKNAGTYNATVSLKAPSTTTWADGTTTPKNLSWEINPKTVSVVWGNIRTWTYDGSYHIPTATASTGIAGETLSLSVTQSQINVGTYTAYASISNVNGGLSSNYTLTNTSVSFSITAGAGHVNLSSDSGTSPYGTYSATFTISDYSGGTLNAYETTNTEATVSISGTIVTISNLSRLPVGTQIGVKVTSEATSNYQGTSVDYTLTIVKANIYPTVYMSDYTYAGVMSTPSVSGNTGYGSVTYYYTTNNVSYGGTPWSRVTSSTYLNAGTYYMYAEVGATTNYNGAVSGPTRFVVKKANITGSVTIQGTNKYQSQLQAMVSVSPSDCALSYQWYSNSSNSTTGGTRISGATSRTYTIGPGLAGKYIYVEVTASKANYNTTNLYDVTDAARNQSATVLKIQLPKPRITGTYIYNGTTQTVGVTSEFDGSKMSIRDNSKIDAGTYTAVISLNDPNDYEWTDGTTTNLSYNWTIQRKSVTAVWGSQTIFVYNKMPQAPTVTAESGVPGETLVLTRTMETDAGKYTSTASIASVTGGQRRAENYTLTSITKDYEIKRATGTFEITKPDDNPEKSEGKGIVEGDNKGTQEGTTDNEVMKYTYTVTVVAGNSLSIKYSYNGDIEAKVDVDTSIATITVGKDNFTIKGISEGNVLGTITYTGSRNYKDVIVSVNIIVLRANYKIERNGKVTYYNKLKDAVDSAENGDTITVLEDVEEKGLGEVDVNKDLTLDLQDKHVTRDDKVEVEPGAKLTVVGEEKNGKKGTLENTEGPAIENKGTLELGENKERDVEDDPVLKGKNKAVETEEGDFYYESGTLVGEDKPPYDGRPKVPVGYYIETTEEDDGLNHSKLLRDKIPPEIYADYIGELRITTRDEVNLVVNVKEEDSGLDPNEFTKEDLIFEVDGVKVEPEVLALVYMDKVEGTGIYRYALEFGKIEKTGELTIRVEANRVHDIAQLGNMATIITEGEIVIYQDTTPPDLGDAHLHLIEPEDGVTDTGDYEVEIKDAKDDNEVTEYQWEVRRKGASDWEIVGNEEGGEEGSHFSGHFDEEGEYEIRVRVSDRSGNHSYSNSVTVVYTEDKNYNSRPTISFEKEVIKTNNEITAVKIKATIKSSTEIVTIIVNGNDVESVSSTKIQEGLYQIRTDVEYEALVNASYKFEVTDSQGNITSEICNVSEINRDAASITYRVVDASLSENAKIVFTSNEEVILSGTLPTGYSAEDKYINTYQKEIIVKVPTNINKIEETFTFTDRVGNETKVIVNEDVETEVRYIRTTSTIGRKLTEVYGGSIKLERAMNLVNRMKTAQERKNEKIISYYGVDSTEINMLVSSEDDLDVARALGSAKQIQVSTSEGIVDLNKGASEIITQIEAGISSSTNSNLTGVMIRESSLITRDKDGEGNSFHVTIINK